MQGYIELMTISRKTLQQQKIAPFSKILDFYGGKDLYCSLMGYGTVY
jgi:hypothetical protein